MTTTINAQKFALAATVTMVIIYVTCSIFVVLFPGLALKFSGWMLHLVNVKESEANIAVTPAGFIMGLIPILGYAYVGTWIFASLYNRFVSKPR